MTPEITIHSEQVSEIVTLAGAMKEGAQRCPDLDSRTLEDLAHTLQLMADALIDSAEDCPADSLHDAGWLERCQATHLRTLRRWLLIGTDQLRDLEHHQQNPQL